MSYEKIVELFVINTGVNRTTEEVVAAGKYKGVVRRINLNYPMRPMPEGGREIVLIGFEGEPKFPGVLTSELAIEVAKRHGLERPRYEDALLFGEQYPKKGQNEVSVVFLHDPRLGLGNECVLVLRDRGRQLTERKFHGGWNTKLCLFAFIKP